MTPKFVFFFFTCEYSEFAGFCADFEYVGIIENQLRESYLPNTFAFLAVTFCSHITPILLGGFGISIEFGAVLISIFKFCKGKSFLIYVRTFFLKR
jgi:hypothetical protein